MPKTPEEWLKEIKASARHGRLPTVLGYAPGVGKRRAHV